MPEGLFSLLLCLSFHGIRIKIKISDLILQLHLLQLLNLNWRENVVRINFQHFVFVGFVHYVYVLFRKMVKIIKKSSNGNYSGLSVVSQASLLSFGTAHCVVRTQKIVRSPPSQCEYKHSLLFQLTEYFNHLYMFCGNL